MSLHSVFNVIILFVNDPDIAIYFLVPHQAILCTFLLLIIINMYISQKNKIVLYRKWMDLIIQNVQKEY